jgi:hypothetical protein
MSTVCIVFTINTPMAGGTLSGEEKKVKKLKSEKVKK